MNKKLLSVVIGAALSGSIVGFASVAQADVQLYGQLDVSVDSHDCDGAYGGNCNGYSLNKTGFNGTGPSVDSQSMNMNSNLSWFGIKGTEDLGNGLKAIFNVMFSLDVAGGNSAGSDTLADNQKWLGVSGDFGTVRAGTVATPYNDHGAMIDPFFGTSLEANQSGIQSRFLHNEYSADEFANGLSNRTIRFDSNDMNGLSGSVFYTLGGESKNNTGGNSDNPYGLGVQYKNGNILGFVDYLTSAEGSNITGDDTAWDLGGQYTMGNIALFGMYERGGLVGDINGIYDDRVDVITNDDSSDSSANVWHLGGSFTMGNTLLSLAYAKGDADTTGLDATTEDDQYSAWTLGVKHSLSTRTSVYAGFNQIDRDVQGQSDHFAMGMDVKF